MKERTGFELEISQLMNSSEYSIPQSYLNEEIDVDTFQIFETPYTVLSKRLNYTDLAQKIDAALSKTPPDKIEIYLNLQRLEMNSTVIAEINNEYNKKYKISLVSAIQKNLKGSEREFALQLLKKGTKGALEEIKKFKNDSTYMNKAAIRLNKEFSKGAGNTKPEVIFAILIPFERKPRTIFRLDYYVYKKKFKKFFRDSILDFNRKDKEYGLYLLGEQPILNTDTNAQNVTSSLLPKLTSSALNEANNVFKKSVSKTSMLYTTLTRKYLKNYFSKPSLSSAIDAINKIGKVMNTREISKGIFEVQTDGRTWRRTKNNWEIGAHLYFKKMNIHDLKYFTNPMFADLKNLRLKLGGNISAATDILRYENTKYLQFLDVPFLLGEPNPGTEFFDKDVLYGGKNVSQLMHWATGVKYSAESKNALREVFLLYELWHLEGWDVFGQDPINDLIAEEQGRILGVELLKGSSGRLKTEKDLISFLNDSFLESRAWVGALLKLRISELDQWIISKEQKRAAYHWTEDLNYQWHIWNSLTIYQMLADGLTSVEVKSSAFYKSIMEIYSLIYESDQWTNKHGSIGITKLQTVLLQGYFNIFLRYENQKELSKQNQSKHSKYNPITSSDLLIPVDAINKL